MADQQSGKQLEELTPDQCIDFAAGLLTADERDDVLRRAAAFPESGELLRTVMAQSEIARSAAAVHEAEKASDVRNRAWESSEAIPAADLRNGFRRFLAALFAPVRLVPVAAGASLLILGLLIGSGTTHLLESAGTETGAPARLISLYPAATRTAGPAAIVRGGTGLYLELNGIEYPCRTQLLFEVSDPLGHLLLTGRLHCHPETGQWAGLYLPEPLLANGGSYLLILRPISEQEDSLESPLEFRFTLR